MRVVIQRVSRGDVVVDGECIGRIDAGLLVLAGFADGDGEEQPRRARGDARVAEDLRHPAHGDVGGGGLEAEEDGQRPRGAAAGDAQPGRGRVRVPRGCGLGRCPAAFPYERDPRQYGGGREGRDSHGRYFNYLSRDELLEVYARSAPWIVVSSLDYVGGGYENTQGPWVAITARRPA